jgi:polar amino acid transport system permease protein
LRRLFILDGGQIEIRPIQYAVNALLVTLLLAAIFLLAYQSLDYNMRWDQVWEYRLNFVQGFLMTILISALSMVLSLIIGVISGVGQGSRFIVFRMLSKFYVEVIRGTPLLVQILVFYYVVANALGIDERYTVGIIIMSMFAGAYTGEIIRSGIDNVAASQLESARSIGLTNAQTYRYIIIPQVITRILPPLTGQFASLIKDSSLLSVIAIREFTMAAREVNANTFSTLESYLPLAIGYLMLTLPISLISRNLEKNSATIPEGQRSVLSPLPSDLRGSASPGKSQ